MNEITQCANWLVGHEPNSHKKEKKSALTKSSVLHEMELWHSYTSHTANKSSDKTKKYSVIFPFLLPNLSASSNLPPTLVVFYAGIAIPCIEIFFQCVRPRISCVTRNRWSTWPSVTDSSKSRFIIRSLTCYVLIIIDINLYFGKNQVYASCRILQRLYSCVNNVTPESLTFLISKSRTEELCVICILHQKECFLRAFVSCEPNVSVVFDVLFGQQRSALRYLVALIVRSACVIDFDGQLISSMSTVSWRILCLLLQQTRCLCCSNCVGCDIVQADHAPDGRVAQGIIHGVVIRHHGRNQEEVEEELEKEQERQEKENTQEQVRMTMTMDEMERHCEALESMWQCEQVSATHLKTARNVLSAARWTRQCALCCSRNWSQWSQCRWKCAWGCAQCSVAFLYHKMFVNFWCRMYCIYTPRRRQ